MTPGRVTATASEASVTDFDARWPASSVPRAGLSGPASGLSCFNVLMVYMALVRCSESSLCWSRVAHQKTTGVKGGVNSMKTDWDC